MKKSVLVKINKTLEILTAPAVAITAVWTADVHITAIVGGTFALAESIVAYLQLFAKK